MILGRALAAVLEAVFSGALFAQAAAPSKESLPHRPDWVIAAALVVLMGIFVVVALAYLGAFRRKDSRPYGWWW